MLSFLAQPDYETMVTLGKTSYDVAVQVKDAGNKTFVKTLKIVIVNANDTPTVSNAISDQAVTEDSSFNFQFNENVFADVDSTAALTYAVTLSDDTVLPQWLTFNAATRTFGGTPTNSDVGSIAVKLTATDAGGAVVSDIFNIVVSNLNDAPTVANAIPDQTISNGSAMYFKFDSTTFADVDVSDTLSYVASLSDGTALPSWLIFDATARTFTGTPTASNIGSLAIKVTATDTGSLTVLTPLILQ